jgi:hypothetical protein
MKGMTAGFAGSRAAEDLSYAKLKAQAMYIGGRAGEIEGTQEEKDKSHERAAQGAAAYLSYRQLLDFDPAQLAVPTDRYAPGAAGSAPKKARTAEVTGVIEWAERIHLGRLSNYTKSGAGPERYDQKLLDALGSDVDAVRATLDALGTKSRGGPFATRELPRNRQLAGSFVANSYLVAGGALRAQFFLLQVSYLLDRMSYLLDGKFRTNQVAQVLPVAQAAVAAIPIMQALAGSYITDLEALAADLPGFTKVDGAAGLAKSLGNINRTLANAQGKLNAAAQNRPEAIVNALRFTSG